MFPAGAVNYLLNDTGLGFSLDPFQPGTEDVVEHRQENQGQRSGEEQTENVDGGKRMPESATGVEKREQPANRGEHGHEHGAQPNEPGLHEGFFPPLPTRYGRGYISALP